MGVATSVVCAAAAAGASAWALVTNASWAVWVLVVGLELYRLAPYIWGALTPWVSCGTQAMKEGRLDASAMTHRLPGWVQALLEWAGSKLGDDDADAPLPLDAVDLVVHLTFGTTMLHWVQRWDWEWRTWYLPPAAVTVHVFAAGIMLAPEWFMPWTYACMWYFVLHGATALTVHLTLDAIMMQVLECGGLLAPPPRRAAGWR